MNFLWHHLHEGLKSKFISQFKIHLPFGRIYKIYMITKNGNTPYTSLWVDSLTIARFLNQWVIEKSAMFRVTSQLEVCGDNITNEEMIENHTNIFTHQICSCNYIVKKVLRNFRNWFHVYLWLSNTMSFWWKIMKFI